MTTLAYLEGIDRFHSLRLRAEFKNWLARLTHRCRCLSSLEELTGRPSARQRRDVGIRFVPIDHIVGSVGRRHDFTRDFLPRGSGSAQRWAQVYAAMSSPEGLPEIEVLKIGDSYVVEDGHHRVSAARAAGLDQIAAHIVEVLS